MVTSRRRSAGTAARMSATSASRSARSLGQRIGAGIDRRGRSAPAATRASASDGSGAATSVGSNQTWGSSPSSPVSSEGAVAAPIGRGSRGRRRRTPACRRRRRRRGCRSSSSSRPAPLDDDEGGVVEQCAAVAHRRLERVGVAADRDQRLDVERDRCSRAGRRCRPRSTSWRPRRRGRRPPLPAPVSRRRAERHRRGQQSGRTANKIEKHSQNGRVVVIDHGQPAPSVAVDVPTVTRRGRVRALRRHRRPGAELADDPVAADGRSPWSGPNGSGKSTLLLAARRPAAADVGHRRAAARRTGRVRRPAPAPAPLDADQRRRGPAHGPLRRTRAARPPRADRSPRRSSAAAERMDVTSMLHRPFGELSGGQRQRVLVAQALAAEPDLLLLDEPITGLDLASQQRILEVVAEETAAGTTVVLSTHHLGEARRTDRVLLLAGCVIADGPPDAGAAAAVLLTEAFGNRMSARPRAPSSSTTTATPRRDDDASTPPTCPPAPPRSRPRARRPAPVASPTPRPIWSPHVLDIENHGDQIAVRDAGDQMAGRPGWSGRHTRRHEHTTRAHISSGTAPPSSSRVRRAVSGGPSLSPPPGAGLDSG